MATYTYFMQHLRMSHNSRSTFHEKRKNLPIANISVRSLFHKHEYIFLPIRNYHFVSSSYSNIHALEPSPVEDEQACGATRCSQQRGACQAESETKAKKGANRPGQSRARQSNTESRSGIQKRFGLSAAFSTLSAKFDVALFRPRNDEWGNANSETSHPTGELTLGTERNSYAKLAENHRKFGCVSNHSNQPRPDSTRLFNHLVSLLLVAGCVSS